MLCSTKKTNKQVYVMSEKRMRREVATRAGTEVNTSTFSSSQSDRLTGESASASQIAANTARSQAG
jgi:hypothetical protein